MLPALSSFVAYSNEFPFLFWTVMLTAMRGKSNFQDRFKPLAEEVCNMAYGCARPTNANFHSMQALLLLCYWNPPFDRIANDPSLSFISMATQIGLRLGLHRPDYTSDFDVKSCVTEDMRIFSRITWVVCFISNIT